MSDQTVFSAGQVPPVLGVPLWQWNTASGFPTVSGYPQGNGVFAQTKTGLAPSDLRNMIGVPLQYYGNPPVPVDDPTAYSWIRQAEDMVEQETSILLCQTWVASPPTLSPLQTQACGMLVNSAAGAQIRGIDYDLEDSAYDFMFSRAQDEGWMELTLRYRPVQSVTYGNSGSPATLGYTAIKNTAFIYPLLNQFFRIPPTWNVEDRDYGLVRYVPAANVQMLPLFAMQLAFMGFAEDVPGAIWVQYNAGLTQFDYSSRYSFMRRLVLCEAATMALRSIQGTLNLGFDEIVTTVDGLSQRFRYGKDGPFGSLISQFEKECSVLLNRAKNYVQGPSINYV